MITQELIDNLQEGHFDEDMLDMVNTNLSLLDAGIDEEFEAGDNLFETALFDENMDTILFDEEYNESNFSDE